jgi:hypothetical protein
VSDYPGTTEDSSPTPPIPPPAPDPAPAPGEPPTEPEPQAAATADAESEQPDDAAGAAETRTAPSRTLVRSLAVLATLFFLGTVAMGILAASQHRKLVSTTSDRDNAEQVASRMASALVTYDYRNLDKYKSEVASRATGKFRNEFQQGFQGLDVFIVRAQSRSTGTVKNVFLDAIRDNSTTAVAVLDQSVQGLSGTQRRFDSYVELTLVKLGGKWKVDGVSYLNPAAESGQGGGATSTPAPPK